MRKDVWKKILFRLAAAFVICLCAVFCVKSLNTEAATKKMATESNGKYLYYSVQGTIYRMDTNSGKTKKIKKIPKTIWVTDITYYKGYLYFTADYFYYEHGTDGNKKYVCRIKTNGKGFRKLGCGSEAKIYNGKIYYVRGKIISNGYSPHTECVGIAKMDLNGKGKKTLVSGGSSHWCNYPVIVKNRIYFRYCSNNTNYLCSTNMSGGDKKYLASDVREILSDGKDIYYTVAKELHKISGSSGEDRKLFGLSWRRNSYGSYIPNLSTPLAVKNGNVYYFDTYNSNYTLKRYSESANKITALKKINGFVNDLHIGKGKYMTIRRSISGNYKYSECVGRIRTNGKSYKTLKKYYRP